MLCTIEPDHLGRRCRKRNATASALLSPLSLQNLGLLSERECTIVARSWFISRFCNHTTILSEKRLYSRTHERCVLLHIPEGKQSQQRQYQEMQRLIDHHAHHLQVALTIKSHPASGAIHSIDQPVRDKDDAAKHKVECRAPISNTTEPKCTDGSCCVNRKVHPTAQGEPSLFFAPCHPIVLQ